MSVVGEGVGRSVTQLSQVFLQFFRTDDFFSQATMFYSLLDSQVQSRSSLQNLNLKVESSLHSSHTLHDFGQFVL